MNALRPNGYTGAERERPGGGLSARTALHRGLCATLVASILFVSGCGQSKPLPHGSQTIEGMEINLGVIPAELIRGHSTQPNDPNALHGGAAPNTGSHHIVVALFDARTGARITDARIRAGVGERSSKQATEQWLEPMQIAGTTTYGAFFPMTGREEWRIHLEIYRPGQARPVAADFGYEHAPGY
jgi:hypothetical protein